MKVIKVGGSIISDKSRPFSLNTKALSQIASEIYSYISEYGEELIIIHGGGSFGHPIVNECLDKYGELNTKCFSLTAAAMDILNKEVIMELNTKGIPSVSVPPHTLCTSIKDLKYSCNLSIVKELVRRGLVPVLYGDVVIGREGYSVISGDVLAWIAAREFNASTIVFVTDVDGLYTEDPKVNPNARLIKEASIEYIIHDVNLGPPVTTDVTGGMRLKLTYGLRLGVRGVKVLILSINTKGNLYNALVGREFRGTIIWY